jgi:hypothetical protein
VTIWSIAVACYGLHMAENLMLKLPDVFRVDLFMTCSQCTQMARLDMCPACLLQHHP